MKELIMKFLEKLMKLIKVEKSSDNHPQDIRLEKKMHENALTEIELRDN